MTPGINLMPSARKEEPNHMVKTHTSKRAQKNKKHYDTRRAHTCNRKTKHLYHERHTRTSASAHTRIHSGLLRRPLRREKRHPPLSIKRLLMVFPSGFVDCWFQFTSNVYIPRTASWLLATSALCSRPQRPPRAEAPGGPCATFLSVKNHEQQHRKTDPEVTQTVIVFREERMKDAKGVDRAARMYREGCYRVRRSAGCPLWGGVFELFR